MINMRCSGGPRSCSKAGGVYRPQRCILRPERVWCFLFPDWCFPFPWSFVFPDWCFLLPQVFSVPMVSVFYSQHVVVLPTFLTCCCCCCGGCCCCCCCVLTTCDKPKRCFNIIGCALKSKIVPSRCFYLGVKD